MSVSNLTREAELALLIAEQEADDRYTNVGSGWSRRVSLDAPLTDDGFTLADVLGEDDSELTVLIEEERTAIRLVRDDRVTEKDVASWRWARCRRKWTYAQIAAHFGVTEAVVYYHLKKPKRLPSHRRDQLESKLAIARAAYENGATLLAISVEFYEESGYATPWSCYQRLRELFHEHKIPLRPGGTYRHGLRSRDATEDQRRRYQEIVNARVRERRTRRPRCPHITKRGRPCRREVITGEGLCVVHARHVPAKWTRQRVSEALNDWRHLTGSFPRARDWPRATADHPTFKTVYDLFGSWQAALDEAELSQVAA